MTAKKSKGIFITIEGNEGAGKSTQVKMLEALLSQRYSRSVSVVREPGTTAISDKIRSILKDPQNSICPEAELFLFQAARAQTVNDIIKPRLMNGEIVIADRFFDSTWVYQGFARGINLLAIEFTNKLATLGIEINKTFYIDVPLEVSIQRLQSRGTSDRFEKEGKQLLEKVYNGYQALINTYPARIEVINGNRAVEEVQRDLFERVTKVIGPDYEC